MVWRFSAVLALAGVLCLFVFTPVRAQGSGQANLVATSTTCPGNGCLTVNVNGMGNVGIQVSGTWTGTISFTGSIDGANYVALNVFPIAGSTAATATTANGAWSAGCGGLVSVRVAVTSAGTGTAAVSINAIKGSVALAGTAGSGGGGAGGVSLPLVLSSAVQKDPSVVLIDQSQPADQRQWRIWPMSGGYLNFDAENDAGALVSRMFFLNRATGNLKTDQALIAQVAQINIRFDLTELAFANVGTPNVGSLANINDSTTNTIGATVAGGGTNHVLARYNGTIWKIIGL